MKCNQVDFKPGQGISVGSVTGVPDFIKMLEELDFTEVAGAIGIMMLKDGTLIHMAEWENRIECLGSMKVVADSISAGYGENDVEEEDDDEEREGD